MVAETLGHYRLRGQVGAGGMGMVYKADDTRLGRSVAIKLLREDVLQDRDGLARIEREARLLASLNHPNIAAIHGLEHVQGTTFLVLEFVPGRTLAERLKARDISLKEGLAICKQIADALEAAHERGIIHRDLKPGNVKITDDGTVKVLDFGIAKALHGDDPGADVTMTRTEPSGSNEQGVILGTAAYMSPEQACGKPLDRRTDIWSFGCVLYEVLARKRAFAGATVTEILAAVLEREPDWQALPPTTPPAISRIVRRCLEKDPRRRMRDVGDARLELEDVLAGHSADAVAIPAARGRRIVASAMIAGLFVGALGTWMFSRRPSNDGAAAGRPVARFNVDFPAGASMNSGFNPQVAISSDGTQVAFGAGNVQTGQSRILLRRIGDLEATPVEGTTGGAVPFFSPDGRWLGFRHPGTFSIKKVALSGGAAVQIAGDITSTSGLTWGEDDTIVFANINLFRVPGAGGTPETLLAVDRAHGERSYRFPEFLPGGKAILITIATEDIDSYDDARIAVFDLSTRRKKVLIEGGMQPRYSPSGHIVYARGGSLLAVPFDLRRLEVTGQPTKLVDTVFMSVNTGAAQFAIARDGTLLYAPGDVEGGERLPVWVDREGGATPLPLPERSYLHPRISPDGKTLAIEVEGPTHNLYAYDFARGTFTKLTFDGLSHWPVWTPAGDRLTFRSWRTGAFTMWSMPADRSGPEERLTTIGNMQSASSWSPHGDAVLFTQVDARTGSDVFVLPVSGDHTPRPLAQSRFAEGSPKFSPDGRWIAYCSNESGRPEVYVQAYPGPGAKIQISTDGGTDPIWSRSSGELFYRNGDRMMAVKVQTSPTFSASKPTVLWEGHYSHGMSSSCGNPGPTSANYDVTPDGSRFLMIRDKDQDVVARRLVVALHWADQITHR